MRYSQMPSRLTHLCEQLPIARISPRPRLQRGQDPASLESLAESIRRCGLQRPVIVRRTSPGRYVIVSGNRRLMACRMLGMLCISVRVLRDDARWQSADCLLDALMRRRMHYLEAADALQALHAVHGMGWSELGELLGDGASLLRAQAGLTVLADEVKALLMEEGVPLGIALTLMRLPDDRARITLAERIAKERLCIRDSALLVSAALHGCRNGKAEIAGTHDSTNRVGNWDDEGREMSGVGNWSHSREPAGGRRIIGVARDVRLYLNSIRQIAAQMQAAGFRATVAERRVGGETELLIRVPVRRRRSDRYQSV